MQNTHDQAKKDQHAKTGSCSGDAAKSSGSCGTDAKKTEQMSSGSCSTTGKGKSGSCG